MYKQISGIVTDKEVCREALRKARGDYVDSVIHFANKKDEHKELKDINEQLRTEMKREERMAKSFKFTTMKKRTPFLPSLKQKGQLEDKVTAIDKGETFRDDRVKQALIHPDRVKDRSKKFALTTTCDGDIFTKEAGREIDQFDEHLMKYFNTQERGTIKPGKDEKGMSMAAMKVSNVWAPNNFSTKLIENLYSETPRLLDRTNTPRAASRAITLDRNYSNKKWLYNKNTNDHFDPAVSKAEINRSKMLKRLTRRQEKQRDRFLTKRHNSVNDGTLMSAGMTMTTNPSPYATQMHMQTNM